MKPTILSHSPTVPPSRPFAPLRIVDRYLLREVVTGFAAATVILLLVMVGGAVADLLAKVARGRIPADLLFSLIGLRTVGALNILLPLAALIAVLVGYGRVWRDSEMAVLQSSGFDLVGLLRPLAMFALPTMLLLGAVSFWLAPAADRLARRLLTEANRSLIVAGLEPGRFVELPSKDGVIHVGEMSADGTTFKRLFIESERVDAKAGATRIDVITATHGFLYHDPDGEGRYIALQDGFRVEGKLGEDDFRLMRFARNDIKLPDSVSGDSENSVKQSATTSTLFASADDPVMQAELHWRLAAPVSVIVLTLLGLPLSRSSPREPRYARLLLALLAWLVYYNALLLGRGWIGQGKVAPWFGLWWVYLPALAIAAWLIWSGTRLKRPRQSAPGHGLMRLPTFKRVDRRSGVAMAVLATVLTTWITIVALDAFRVFIVELNSVGEGQYTLAKAAAYVLLTVPRRFYEMFGYAALIGGLLGLGGLANTGELTALRAAGLSKLRICASVALCLGALMIATVILGETVGPYGERKAQALQLAAQSKDVALAKGGALWARDAGTVIGARHGRSHGGRGEVDLDGVRLFEFDAEGRLASLSLANSAVYADGQWTLNDMRRTEFGADRATSSRIAKQSWQSSLDPHLLATSIIKPQYMTLRDLGQNIAALARNGQDASTFRSEYWARVYYPFNVLILVFCAMPFAFGALRSGGLSKRLFLGIVLALGFYLLQRSVVSMGSVYNLHPALANLIPPALLVGAAFAWFRRNA